MKIDLLKVKKELRRLIKVPSLIARHFWISLAVVFALSLAITAFFFYQYVIFLPEERVIDHRNLFQVNEQAYKEVIELRKGRFFEGEGCPDLFGPPEEDPVD